MGKGRRITGGILAGCLLLSGCAQMPPASGPGEETAETAAAISAVGSVRETDGGTADAGTAGDTDAARSTGLPEAGEVAEEPEEEPETVWEDWWAVPVFAHAMGTVDGRTETNSLDAFLASYEAGHRVFEVDLQLTSDGHLIARHDWEQMSYYNAEQVFAGVMDWETFQRTPICFFYTPVDIDGLVSLMQAYPDIYFVTDSKDTGEENVRAQMKEIARAMDAAGDPALWDRLIVQIYHEDMYAWVSEEAPVTNWIFTLYQIVAPDYERTGAFCKEHGIPVVTMESQRLTREHVEILHSYDCRIYVHTVNRLRTMLELSWGADGFYSDFVAPGELEAVWNQTNQMYLGDIQALLQDGQDKQTNQE